MNHPESLSQITLVGIEAALAAGDLLRHGFGTEYSISFKPDGNQNLVTEFDTRSEKLIIDFIRNTIPEAQFLAEEGGKTGSPSSSILWIIDPLDGTVNFAHKIPVFAVSIAAQKNGQTICGIIYQPITQELFVAEKGVGAFVNGLPLKVSSVKNLDHSLLATGFPYNLIENPSHCIESFLKVLHLGIPIRRLGSAAIDLAYTAAGRFDGFFEPRLAPWDCAAGILLIEEAKGKVSHWNRQPFDLFANQPLLATNGLIHDELAQILGK